MHDEDGIKLAGVNEAHFVSAVPFMKLELNRGSIKRFGYSTVMF